MVADWFTQIFADEKENQRESARNIIREKKKVNFTQMVADWFTQIFADEKENQRKSARNKIREKLKKD